jgi:aminopeptidase-like protein
MDPVKPEVPDLEGAVDPARIGQEIHALIERLYPFCRSLTGDGVRATLRHLSGMIPLDIHEVPSGTQAFDWVVPPEWNVRDAYVLDCKGQRVIDFRSSNLHVVGYSSPVNARMTREELLAHVFTDPQHPEWIPYKHTYYRANWGFCVAHQELAQFTEPYYDVRIDTTLAPGSLTFGECFLPGKRPQEILISTHTCHPSLCNDNLSGIAVAAMLARALATAERELSYRFLFLPATLGPLVWLSRNEERLSNIAGGLVVAGVGDCGDVTYIKSRKGDTAIDRAVAHVLAHGSGSSSTREFVPTGYDQRQYCSPAFDLPVGCIMRTPHGCYAEYHTSADNLEFVSPVSLADSYHKILSVLAILDANRHYVNQSPKGEPELGRRGLFQDAQRLGLLWTLNYSDGRHDLLEIADRAGIPFRTLLAGARKLEACDLIREVRGS